MKPVKPMDLNELAARVMLDIKMTGPGHKTRRSAIESTEELRQLEMYVYEYFLAAHEVFDGVEEFDGFVILVERVFNEYYSEINDKSHRIGLYLSFG